MNEFENNDFKNNDNEENHQEWNHQEEIVYESVNQDQEPDYNQGREAEETPIYAQGDPQGSQSYGSQSYGSQRFQYSEYNQSNPDKKNKKRKRRKKTGLAKLVASAVIFGVIAGACFVGISIAKDKLYPSKADRIETTTATTSSKNDTASSGSQTYSAQDVSDVVSTVMPSVVSITSTIQSSSYYGYGSSQESQGAGSGFIIAKTKKYLMIATNNHVVSGATSLTVGFSDDTTASATIVGTDSDADLAVISVKLSDIKEKTASTIKVATLGDSDKLKVGETVVAIGNALGYGQSVTTGVVSAKNREVSFTDGTMTLLQTDAAINPGNSGGVLINMSGQVIGINNAKLEDTSVEGMGYAIPISTAKTVLEDLMNAESVNKNNASFLGVIGKDIDSNYSQALGIPTGIYVSQVVSGSPAEKAGISAGDVIVKFEGNTVSTMEGLKEKLSLKTAGTKVKITFQRVNQSGEYESKTVTVKLGKKSDFKDITDDSTESSNDSNSNSNGSSGNSGNSNGNSGNSGNSNSNSGNSGNSNGNSGNGSTNPYEYFFGNGSDGNDNYSYNY